MAIRQQWWWSTRGLWWRPGAIRDSYYYWDAAVSEHPAYPFRLSARDLARFGWLNLNAGQWAGEQVVPAAWVTASTQTHAETGRDADWGYLW